MKEYIERNFALYVVKHFGGMLTWCKEDVVSEIIRVLNNSPAADVVEVRHGKNLSEDDPSRFECSECGWKCWDTYCGDTITYSFCPNCGAKMDMEE